MNMAARVKSIEGLGEWKNNLKRFVAETLDRLRVIEGEIRRTEEWLGERLNYWLHMVQQHEQEVMDAERHLSYCEQNDYDTMGASMAVHEANRRLEEAEEELKTVQFWKQQVDNTAAAYRAQAERTQQLLNTDMSRGDMFLEKAINDLQAYIAVNPVSGQRVEGLSHNEVEGILPIVLTGLPLATPKILAHDEVEGILPADLTILPQSKLQKPVPPIDEKIPSCQILGSEEEIKKLNDSLDKLEKTKYGSKIAKIIKEKVKAIYFEVLEENALAKFDPVKDCILINIKLKDAPPSAIAAYLGHEGIHAQQKALFGLHVDSIDEEEYAMRAQSIVWKEAKGLETDSNLNGLLKIMGQQKVFRDEIRKRYPWYMEYLTPLVNKTIYPFI